MGGWEGAAGVLEDRRGKEAEDDDGHGSEPAKLLSPTGTLGSLLFRIIPMLVSISKRLRYVR